MSLPSPKTGKLGQYGTRQPWLLLYNCQVVGLGNSLNLLCDQIDVEHFDPGSFRRQANSILPRLDRFDRILVAPQLVSELGDAAAMENVWQIPAISFNAYHPDICYLWDSGSALKGPMGDYHSLIVYAAFVCGRSETQAAALFCESTYARLGYFDRWDAARKGLLDTFAEHGLDLAPYFVNWSRNGAFMYSFNHPRLHCLGDVARAILARAGLQASYADAQPHDNLANGPIFPIYPEIASRLGVAGSYLFKLGGRYQFIRLDEFISESFRLYRDNSRAAIRPEFARLLTMATDLIKGGR